ncbi:class I SAM-dependent methyltransferase [Prevotella melaninogenica]
MKLFTANQDFYPTPEEVINTMMMGENFIGKTILEPSAGKGNIVDWLKANGAGKVIACEKDKNLQKLLTGKCEILADDFLSVTAEQVSHVDYIVMNPPFSDGIRHILHAFEIAPAGCVIIALCNSHSVCRGWEHNSTPVRDN